MRHWTARMMTAAAVVLLVACAPAHDARDLLTQIQSQDSEVREDAKQKIAAILKAGDFKVFERGAREGEGMVRVHSILYLARFTEPEAREALRGLLAVERRAMIPYSPIRMRVTSELTDSRILVAHLIHQNGGDPQALDVLVAGVEARQSPEIVTGTCFALGALHDPRGVPFLKSATASGETAVVRAAVEALVRIAGPEALDALLGVADHPSVEVRTDLLLAFELRREPGTATIVRRFALTDPASEVRALAAQQVARFPVPEAVPVLIEILRDRTPEVRVVAHEALVQIAGKNLAPRPEIWARWWATNRKRLAPPAG